MSLKSGAGLRFGGTTGDKSGLVISPTLTLGRATITGSMLIMEEIPGNLSRG